MKTYRATARREKKWWVVEVPGVGTTQGRTTAEVQRMAADLVAIMKEIPLEQVRVTVEFEVPGNWARNQARGRRLARPSRSAAP